MKVCTHKSALSGLLDPLRKKGLNLGLVPTMGALHQGHCSLLDRAAKENDVTVVSIFVNPTQFNDPTDLEKYPRTPEQDLALLEAHGADIVFMPAVEEMYPEKDERIFDFGGLDQVMEGRHRPGHFNGVAQIVSKLFEAVEPHRAYFGEKDFQQLAIVKELVRQMGMPLRIVACPIIREADGLAMSSRNARLSPGNRALAPFIHRTLMEARSRSATMDPDSLRRWVAETFQHEEAFSLEYYDIVNTRSLRPIRQWSEPGEKIACIATYLGGVRLIDNVKFA